MAHLAAPETTAGNAAPIATRTRSRPRQSGVGDLALIDFHPVWLSGPLDQRCCRPKKAAGDRGLDDRGDR
jgi:hypothetical protein